MAAFKPLGVTGSATNKPVRDAGTLTPTESARVAVLGTSKPMGDPPRGFLRDFSVSKVMRDAAMTQAGRFGDRSLMNASALLSLLNFYRERWRESASHDSAVYWAMHFERVTEILNFIASPRGQFIVKLDELLSHPEGDAEAQYAKLYPTFIDWFALERGAMLRGVVEQDDGLSAPVLAKAAARRLQLWNQIAQATIPALRREFYQVSRLGASGTLEQRRQQRKRLQELMYGPDASGKPAQENAGRAPDLPKSMTAIVTKPMAIEREQMLMGGQYFAASPEVDQAIDDITATGKQAATEMKRFLVEDAAAAIKDARRRIREVSPALSGTDKLKFDVLVQDDLSTPVRYLLGLERQRQLWPGSGTVSDEDRELQRLVADAEALQQQWKGGPKPAFSIADVPLTDGAEE